ncbi:hypothetical protein [Pseudoalteromonas mariniglutinosa]|uniref:hypothetical protein n=1 Tax=Pseudoalteromonas mariniglutinosa TaxID=206042 RepID=UPI00384EC00C
MSLTKQGCVLLIFSVFSLLLINDSDAATMQFKYNARGRLIEVKVNERTRASYHDDDAGNRVSTDTINFSLTSEKTPQTPVSSSTSNKDGL